MPVDVGALGGRSGLRMKSLPRLACVGVLRKAPVDDAMLARHARSSARGTHSQGGFISLMDILSPYASRPTSTEDDFDEVAKQLPPEVLGDGIAQAFRSDKTPAFGEMVGRMSAGRARPCRPVC